MFITPYAYKTVTKLKCYKSYILADHLILAAEERFESIWEISIRSILLIGS